MTLLFNCQLFGAANARMGEWELTDSSCVGEKMRSDGLNVALRSRRELANRLEVLVS